MKTAKIILSALALAAVILSTAGCKKNFDN
jgi:hypothetical protein